MAPFGIGNLVGKVVSAITEGIFGLFELIANAIVGPVKSAIAEPFLATLLYTPLPKYCPGGGPVQSCSNPRPALVTAPTNGPWSEVWFLYWNRFFITAIMIGLALYVMTNFVAAVPWVSPRLQERLRGGYLKLLVLLPLGWPILAVSLFLIDALNHLIAPNPDRFAFLLTTVISGMVASAASPMAIVTTVIGMIDITLFLIALALFFTRILFIVLVFAIAPLLIMALSLDIPLVKGLARSIFEYWVKLGLAPMAIAGCYKVAAILTTSPDGSGGYQFAGLGIWGSTGMFINLALAMAIPFIGLIGFYFVLQAQMPRSAQLSAIAVQQATPNTKVGDLGKYENENGDVVTSQWRQKIDDSLEGYEKRRSAAIDDNIRAGYETGESKAREAKRGTWHRYRDWKMDGLDHHPDLPARNDSYPKGQAGDNRGPGWRDDPKQSRTETDRKVAAALIGGSDRDSGDSFGGSGADGRSSYNTELINVDGEETEVIDIDGGVVEESPSDIEFEDNTTIDGDGVTYIPSAHSDGIESPVEGNDGVEFEKKETDWSNSTEGTTHSNNSRQQSDTEFDSGSRSDDSVQESLPQSPPSTDRDIGSTQRNEGSTDDDADSSTPAEESRDRSVLEIEDGEVSVSDEDLSVDFEDDLTADVDDDTLTAELDADSVTEDHSDSEVADQSDVLDDDSESDLNESSDGGDN